MAETAAVNLEKQIRRHVIAQRHFFFAATAPGLEANCLRELVSLCNDLQVQSAVAGGVDFSGRLEALYRANLHLRTAGRILLRLTEFKATNFRQLARKTIAWPWQYYLPGGSVPACKVTALNSRLFHTQAVAENVQQAIGAYWQGKGLPQTGAAGQTLYIRLHQDRVLFSLDSSGPNLYQRGIKTHGDRAPLRETLAAAILQSAGFDPTRLLLDPMCGSGTFSLEAALMAKQIPPGSRRQFAFMQWPAFRLPRWRYLLNAAAADSIRLAQPLIHASDLNPDACTRLAECVRQNDLEDAIVARSADFFSLRPSSFPSIGTPGLIVLNPPYGLRLQASEKPEAFYGRIMAKLRADFSGWRLALLVPRTERLRLSGFQLKSTELIHGGLPLNLLVGKILA